MQADPAGGALFTLTALTEIAIVPVQLLLLQVGGRRFGTERMRQKYTFSRDTFRCSFLLCDTDIFIPYSEAERYLQELCDTLREVLVALDVELQLIESGRQRGRSATRVTAGVQQRDHKLHQSTYKNIFVRLFTEHTLHIKLIPVRIIKT